VKFGHSCLSTYSCSKQHPGKKFLYVIENTETPSWVPELVDQLAAVEKLTVVYIEL
jgi:hypothetical protein